MTDVDLKLYFVVVHYITYIGSHRNLKQVSLNEINIRKCDIKSFYFTHLSHFQWVKQTHLHKNKIKHPHVHFNCLSSIMHSSCEISVSNSVSIRSLF